MKEPIDSQIGKERKFFETMADYRIQGENKFFAASGRFHAGYKEISQRVEHLERLITRFDDSMYVGPFIELSKASAIDIQEHLENLEYEVAKLLAVTNNYLEE